MKIIKYKYLFLITTIIATTWACSEEFLEVDAKGQFLTETYYANEQEAFGGLVAVYDVLRKNSGGFENMITMMNAGSDDHYAGGGGETDGMQLQVFSNYTVTPETMANSFWGDYYQGIFRANILLSKLPDVPMDASTITLFEAETKMLRAYYYFNLIRMFKSIPLIIEPISPDAMYDVLQVSREEVYAQIENDLTAAIPNLPAFVSADEAGRLTKGAGQALLGKVYLYQNKNSLAAAQFTEVNGAPGGISQYGYSLMENFNNLWTVDNKFNSESILEIAHTNVGHGGWGNWGSGSDEGNTVNVMVGPRSYVQKSNEAPDMSSGWSFNPILPELYDLMKDDPRFEATILDAKTLKEEGKIDYLPGYLDTGYFLMKFSPKVSDQHNGPGDMVLNYRQNSYAIRLADTYLMEAEALGASGTRAQALLDAVRSRVGLPSVPVSMEAIMFERRMELAGEGHRWFDLVRTGNAPSKLGDRGFQAGKHEFFPIPFKELENTSLVQDPAY